MAIRKEEKSVVSVTGVKVARLNFIFSNGTHVAEKFLNSYVNRNTN